MHDKVHSKPNLGKFREENQIEQKFRVRNFQNLEVVLFSGNSRKRWALSIQSKIKKISKRGQMVRKFPEKVFRKLLNFPKAKNFGNSGRKVKWNENSR